MTVRKLYTSNLFWACLIFAGILLFNALFTPNFFRIEIRDGHLFGSVIDIFDRASPIILMATGMTLVIATKGIDISVGSVAAISGALVAVLIAKYNASPVVFILVPLCVALILGAWNGLLVSWVGMQPIIATLILMVTGRGIAMLITGGQIIVFRNTFIEKVIGGYFLGLPFSILIAVVVALGVSLLTRRTALGIFIESIGINPTACRYAGVRVQQVLFSVFVISATCAGIAGFKYISDIRAADANNSGLFSELDAILAVVIGGTSMNGGRYSIIGSFIGALVIQSLTTTILTRGVPVQVTYVLRSAVVVIICILQSPVLSDRLSRMKKERVEE